MKTKILIFISLACVMIFSGCQKAADHEKTTVCLFFDDGWMNQYEEALPVLLKHDFKATFGVITGLMGTGENFWEYMGGEELNKLVDHDMEIACHTQTHPQLTGNITHQQLNKEIIDTKSYLEHMGFNIETFIYPYYEWNESTIEYVKDAGYSYARGGWPEEGSFKIEALDTELKYHVPSQQITNQDLEDFKAIVEESESNSAICLVYHFIADNGPETTSTPVGNFKEQMAYLKKANFNVVLLTELLT